MGMKWADWTKRARSRLYDELLETMTAAPAVPLQTTAAIMVQRKGVAIQTKLSYAKNLQTILRSMGEETTVISAYIAGLRVMGAEKPIKQADPIS
jgi:two-component SAPR family response regulator